MSQRTTNRIGAYLYQIQHLPRTLLIALGYRIGRFRSRDIKKPSNWEQLTFSEKVSWRCRHPNPLINYSSWVDKGRVKEVVAQHFKTAESYQIVHSIDEIDANNLPATYVMKATHGWDMSLLVKSGTIQGGNRDLTHAEVVADTDHLRSIADAWFQSRRQMKRRLKERQYSFVKPGIIFEQHIEPIDYELQLFLFNGCYRFAMVFFRDFHHDGITHLLYDEQWQKLEPGSEKAIKRYAKQRSNIPPPPSSILKSLVQLCHSVDQVRADFYVCGEDYYFSEFTFTHSGGSPGFIGRYDAELGRFWLP
ncbi:hypothetical protein BOW53_07540 [Solemya pervernicosa gill symbiont]|uniref:Uncharacterized protein n=1 Tax=Solemya pervernicosa gill symbiont TaxID=642797 RepID=A0A1T2L5Y3_9GAMM|nr:ATP-grasp fold amidoligase family protein [Solemya pervernicosa gill symbiont]OOZ40493.1 hypothetical protein BOW53_07540 [Solemya pervernicosa gill symbiont]